MPRQQRIRSNSGYYHIMLRGNERKNIFLNDEDKLRFMETVYEKKNGERFYLHSFCLMDNHIHLMVSEGVEDVARVIKRITVSYVYYFNKKYKRVGHLFQDRFKSEVVEQDNYVLSLARYIHQNPVKAGIIRKAADYRWSSYNSYLNKNNYFVKMLDTDIVMDLFSDDRKVALKKFEEFMNENTKESFIDLDKDIEIMDEEAARKLFERMLIGQGLEKGVKMQPSDTLIKEFRDKTNLPIRKIAAITGLKKDRVNSILRR
ncbi:MAG: transposase [Bacillota bacterium]